MATVLLTWELGAGIGHLMNLRPIGAELVRRGHRVVAAVRSLSQVAEIFAGSGIHFLPAPHFTAQGKRPFEPTLGFAHILANIGFADEATLATLFAAWNTLFDCIQPDLVVADHSPTVFLARRGRPIRLVNVGLGFFCPPEGFPLPYWSRGHVDRPASEQLAADEQSLTSGVNRLLNIHRRPTVTRLSNLFTEIDQVFLATYREFDHYGERPGVRYWGHWPYAGGVEPTWPTGTGPRIYAYLKPFAGLEALLAELRKVGAPTIILAGGIDRAMQERYVGGCLRFEQRPLDLRKVVAQCDLAITNAGHGTTASLLLGGKPCLLLPPFLEQILFAQRVEQLGAGRVAPPAQSQRIVPALQDMLANSKYRANAQAFAARYADFTPGQQVPELVDHLERLLRHSTS